MARDQCVLINGWNKYYRIDLFPNVWEAVGSLITDGTARIPWEILKEIKKQRDGLTDWVEQYKHLIERPTTQEQELMLTLMATYPNIAAQGGSINAGDPWVIVMAQAMGGVVVADEKPQTSAKNTKPPKITFVCDQVAIPWMRPIDSLAKVLPPR